MRSRIVLVAAVCVVVAVGVLVFVGTRPDRAGRVESERHSQDPQQSLRTGADARAADATDPGASAAGDPLGYNSRANRLIDAIEANAGNEAQIRKHLAELRELLADSRGIVDRPTRARLVLLITTVEPRWAGYAGTVVGELEPDPQTTQALLEILKSADFETLTRRGALNAIWGMPAENVAGELLALLGTGREEESQIVEAIGRIGEPDSMLALVDWLGREIDEKTRIEIEKALTLPTGADALKGAVERIALVPPGTRLSILRVVARVGGEEHGEAIRYLLSTNLDEESRRTAIRALGAVGDEESGRTLWALSRAANRADRRAATQAMARIEDRKTIDALIAGADHLDLGTKRALLEAGSRIKRPGPNLVELAEAELGASDRACRLAAIAVVGASRNDRLLDKLMTTFTDLRDRETREAIMEALLVMKTPNATRRGILALASADPSLRRAYDQPFQERLKEFPATGQR